VPASSLPTVFTLIEAMGPNYFMAKSDLKDMFLNFPISDSQWTFWALLTWCLLNTR